MNAHYYESEGMNNVLLYVAAPLKKEFQQKAKHEGIPMRALYSEAIRRFVKKVDAANKKGEIERITFHATFKHPKAVKLQMWLDSELSDEVTRLCAKAAVTRRAFCYSALLNYPLGE